MPECVLGVENMLQLVNFKPKKNHITDLETVRKYLLRIGNSKHPRGIVFRESYQQKHDNPQIDVVLFDVEATAATVSMYWLGDQKSRTSCFVLVVSVRTKALKG